jgi:uncharacterized protein (TIGR02145 family)
MQMKKKITSGISPFILALVLLTLVNSCRKESITIPVLTTSLVSDIDLTSLVCGGNVTGDGGAAVTARGVCWSTNQIPTTDDNKTLDGTGTGSFTSNITGLTANTSYNLRAYASNNIGTSYGDMVVCSTGAVTDVDGNAYRIITIGAQVWMVDNLKTTRYNDGTDIPLVTEDLAWTGLSTPAYCLSNNDEDPFSNYSVLYNWYAVNTGKLCPTGWHVPTYEDWNILIAALGGSPVAGGKLKETGTLSWTSPNTAATNLSGFTAPSGSFRNNTTGTFGSYGYFGYWWCSKEFSTTDAWSVILQYNNAKVLTQANHKGSGLFVRCIKD